MAWICAEGLQKKIWSCGVSQAEHESAMPLLKEHFLQKSKILVVRNSIHVTAGHLVSSCCFMLLLRPWNSVCLLWGPGLQGKRAEWT